MTSGEKTVSLLKLLGQAPYVHSVTAVSYTHLDVYKRQVLTSQGIVMVPTVAALAVELPDTRPSIPLASTAT